MINKISYKPHISTINKTKNISFGNINLDIEAGVLNNFLNTLEDKKTKNQDMQKINNYIKNTIITTEIEDYNRNFKILGFNVNNEELNRPKFSINMETFAGSPIP